MREMPPTAELASVDIDGRRVLAPPSEGGGLLRLHARLVAALSLAAVVRGVVDSLRVDLPPVWYAHARLLSHLENQMIVQTDVLPGNGDRYLFQ
jgi:hypothetical protein